MRKYWRSLEEMESNSDHCNNPESEFSVQDISEDEINGKIPFSRRDFLKVSGFSLLAATLASGCGMPVNQAIPFLLKPEGMTPGIPEFYASTFFDGHDYCSILVKTREGRPIKIEGNPLSAISSGGTNARVQASVLSLYDDFRLKKPLKAGEPVTWEIIDAEIIAKLNELASNGEKLVILASTIISPSTLKVLDDFIVKYPLTEVIFFDSVSASGMLEANMLTFGEEVIPSYRFNNADVIVSFGADFLGTWLSPVEFTRQYSSRREISKKDTNISLHIQIESNLSLTGSNADIRIPVNPSQEGVILLNLYNKIAGKAGATTVPAPECGIDTDVIAKDLWDAKGKALVISGSNETSIQVVVNKINELLESYGSTIDLSQPYKCKQGSDKKMISLVDRMEKGEIKGIILYNVNPAYDYPQSDKFQSGMTKTTLSISFADNLDETAQLVSYVCPDCHYLESWNDAEPVKNSFSLCQPAINKLFDTRQAQESLMKWGGVPATKSETKDPDKEVITSGIYHDYIKKYWEDTLFKRQSEFVSFSSFWTNALQSGIFVINDTESSQKSGLKIQDIDFRRIAASAVAGKREKFEYTVYESVGIGTGKHANNPWLQELPDPVSKVCWDNYLAVSVDFALEYGLQLGDVVSVNDLFEIPVLVQAGQAAETVSIAMGYGRTSAGKVGDKIGKNACRLIDVRDTRIYSGSGLKIVPTGVNYVFALTQTHHSMHGRDHVRHGELSDYKTNPYAGNEKHLEGEKHKVAIYKQREFNGHHWGLAIDLGKCTGCSTCVIACQVENNVPVVGKDEVQKKRIMHWMRIDRYYSEEPGNPEVYFQPVMCQHCDSAPCENVCPVQATQNSQEGLNEMAYNRCIGTRYCMNNCPYRVRRFNWFEYSKNKKFDYNMDSDLGRMVLNPDVVVRGRGVVEKCSFCVQRIQEAKLKAKLENRELADGDIRPACVQACPAGAMIFGDMNVLTSSVNKAFADERKYSLLDEVNTLPSVGYLTKIKRSVKDRRTT